MGKREQAARIVQLEAHLRLALNRLAADDQELQQVSQSILDRDAAFAPVRAEVEELRAENARLRREFSGFVQSIEWWKSELAANVVLEQGALDGSA